MNLNKRDIIFWCIYCKNPIYDGDTFIIHRKNKYHTECFKLLDGDTYGDVNNSYTETDRD